MLSCVNPASSWLPLTAEGFLTQPSLRLLSHVFILATPDCTGVGCESEVFRS